MTGPTQPADDRARIVEALNSCHMPLASENEALRETYRHDGHIRDGACFVCRGDVPKLADAVLDELGPDLEEGRFAVAHIEQWKRVLDEYKADVVDLTDEATAAHTRNAALRSEHRTEVERLDGDCGELRAQREVANKYALEQQERADHLSWDLLAIQRALGWHGDALLDRGLVEARISRIRTERDEAQRAVSRLSGGNTPADAEETAARAIHRFMSSACSWEELPEGVRPTYLGQARAALAAVGWGSAVATPADTQAEPEACNGSGLVADWDAPADQFNVRSAHDVMGEPPPKPCPGCENCATTTETEA